MTIIELAALVIIIWFVMEFLGALIKAIDRFKKGDKDQNPQTPILMTTVLHFFLKVFVYCTFSGVLMLHVLYSHAKTKNRTKTKRNLQSLKSLQK